VPVADAIKMARREERSLSVIYALFKRGSCRCAHCHRSYVESDTWHVEFVERQAELV
jgi:hypothetical protein